MEMGHSANRHSGTRNDKRLGRHMPGMTASSSRFLVPMVVCFAILLAPAVHLLLFFYTKEGARLEAEIIWHIGLNSAVTAAVVLRAATLRRRTDGRISGALNSVLALHGAVAFFILISRQYYSIQIMMTAIFLSVFAGFVAVLVTDSKLRPRLAAIGVPDHLARLLRGSCDFIRSPASDLRSYDVILTDDVSSLPSDWVKALAGAMLAGKQIRHVAEYLEEDSGIVSVDHFDVQHLPYNGINSYRHQKRLVDVILVLVALPLAVPILSVGALVVYLTMGRPILFVQERVGLGGKTFRMFKLRTMRYASEGTSSATEVGDVRVTSAGRWLRRFRVDELPQLLNILIGDMSIVGPRPEQVRLTESYTVDLPAFSYRSLVRPGITGWAQVRAGYASNLEETRIKLSHDLFYIKNFSFALDVQIMIRTIGTLLTGGGVR
jgi:lipopolysaccharide/colanic/teichoic acid biosynthesis glycosyltransferase